jgi:pteridine reductase
MAKMNQRQIALVTGASSTLGQAICRKLAEEGFDLVLHYGRSRAKTRALARELHAAGVRTTLLSLDLSRPGNAQAGLKAVLRKHGRLDLLVNNASRFDETPPKAGYSARWDLLFRVNSFAPFALSMAALPYLSRTYGAIVNIADIYAETPLLPARPAYCASKAALVSLTRYLARELAPRVRVNAVSPGVITFLKGYVRKRKRKLVEKTALKRAGTPWEVAEAVWSLASNRFITGQVLRVDGGRF